MSTTIVENQSTSCDVHSAYIIQQLYKKISQAVEETDGTVCIEEFDKNIFPVGLIQAIYDGKNGKRLDYILSLINCWYLSWEGSTSATKLGVPLINRRRGLIVTYKDSDGNVYTQRYMGDTVNDTDWVNEDNWEGYSFETLSEDIVNAVSLYFQSDQGKQDIQDALNEMLDDLLAEYFEDIQSAIDELGRVTANALARLEMQATEHENRISALES